MSKFFASFFAVIVALSALIGIVALSYSGKGEATELNSNENIELITEAILEDNVSLEEQAFSKFTDEAWKTETSKTDENLENALENLKNYIASTMNLQTVPTIEVVYITEKSSYGLYHQNHIQIFIINIIKHEKRPNQRVLQTVAHELRHDLQHEQIAAGTASPKIIEGNANYVMPEVDYNSYYNNPMEIDARLFGKFWEDYAVNTWIGKENEEAKK